MTNLFKMKNPGVGAPGHDLKAERLANGTVAPCLNLRLDATALNTDFVDCDPALLALAIDLADHLAGDSDFEDTGDTEPNGDELDICGDMQDACFNPLTLNEVAL